MSGHTARLKETLPADIKAGVTVFLVAIPLCLGIALASNAPAVAGLISGIIGGLVIGSISRSQTSVSGPAAGLVAIVLGAMAALGSFQAFLAALVLAGIIQYVLGLLRAGLIAHFVPHAVIKGMLAAIGVILILKQIPHALGYDDTVYAVESFSLMGGESLFNELMQMFSAFTPGAIVISLVSFAGLFVFSRDSIKKQPLLKYVPGALLVIIIAALLNQFFIAWVPSLALEPVHLVSIPLLSEQGLDGVFTQPDFSALSNPALYKYAFLLAIVGSVETLLCVEAADKLDPYRRTTPTNAELKAQGTGNFISGLVGGLPITSVIVRTSVNIETGAKTKKSTLIHGLLLVISLGFAASLINTIPLASLACVLIATGYKLTHERLIISMFKQGMGHFLPFIVTIFMVLVTDLLIGVLCGLVVSIFFLLKNYYTIDSYKLETDRDKHSVRMSFPDYATFLMKGNIDRRLNRIEADSTVVLDFSRTRMVDAEVLESIQDFICNARTRGISVEIVDNPGSDVPSIAQAVRSEEQA